MGKPTGFLETDRHDRAYAPVKERIAHYNEFYVPLKDEELSQQGGRCMDCGIPYCHQGCPVMNIIPDWNDLVYRDDWRGAIDVLHSTNNFPEFTGRICPAPCEAACTLNFTAEAVTIKTIECAIVDKAWAEGWIKPQVPLKHTGKKVAVVGSGPSGLACAQQLARAGHSVVVFEKNPRIGGLLRYGIPDFKMNKKLIDRRMSQMQTEGVEFRPNMHIGYHIPAARLLEDFDAVALTGGSEEPRDLPVTGRDLGGVHFAMDFLTQQNHRIAGEPIDVPEILATGKNVLVIGGGDTGADCVGTSIRQDAASVTQIEIMPRPPENEDKMTTWPDWPNKMRTSTSHEEGCTREWAVTTKAFSGANGKLTEAQCVHVSWAIDENGQWKMSEVPGSQFTIKCDLALLAMGFVHPTHDGMIAQFGVAKDPRGNIAGNTDDYKTSVDKVFAAGDMRRGQSLVVWAIREGRQCARSIDEYLMGASDLPR